MFTMKIFEGETGIFKNADDAIKEYNKGRLMDNQILPSNPFGYRGILGCLGVQVYSITLGTYKENHECIALFTGYNEKVLDISVEDAHVAPGLKAISSLALMGNMICQQNLLYKL